MVEMEKTFLSLVLLQERSITTYTMERDELVRQEIEYRASVENRLYKGEKVSQEELIWLRTHKKFSKEYGYPNLCVDIIEIPVKKRTTVSVHLIKNISGVEVNPRFSPAADKGFIIAKNFVRDIYGNIKQDAKIKLFNPSLDKRWPDSEFVCYSQIGKIAMNYKIMDPRTVPIMKLSGVNPYLTMLCLEATDKKRVYSCTVNFDRRYGDFIFSVEIST